MSDDEKQPVSRSVLGHAKHFGGLAFDLRTVITLGGFGIGLFVQWLNMSNSVVELKTKMTSVVEDVREIKKGLAEEMKGYQIAFENLHTALVSMDSRHEQEMLELRREVEDNRDIINNKKRR